MSHITDPKVAMHVVNLGPGMGMPDPGPKPGIGIVMFDARGEKHAREEAFKWAFGIEGVQEMVTMETSMGKMNAVAESFRVYNGKNMFWLSAPLIKEVEEDTLVKAWKWYEDSYNLHPGLGENSTVLLEFMQEVCTPYAEHIIMN